MTESVLDRIVACLHAALAHDPNVQAAPVALLWPDEAGQWRSVVDRIGERLPLVSLGEYEPTQRRGPAYWVRCVVAGTLDAGLAEGPPVVYLPGVARSDLRAVENCPSELAPIAELQYRSQWFANRKGRDWTVRGLLSDAERGLGLDVADDAETRAALLLALDPLLAERVDRLAKQVLDSDYCNQLVNPDLPRILLGWLDDPAGYRGRLDEAQWSAFLQQCETDYGFDPARDGEISAARKLAARQGNWAHVWKRFEETPERYPGIADQLYKARPFMLIIDNPDAWPQDNEIGEDQLRSRLRDFAVLTADGARREVVALGTEHGWRRGTVWADLDQAPLAFALEQLVVLAGLTAQPLASADLPSLSADYAARGWRADDAVLRALAAARSPADRVAVASPRSRMHIPIGRGRKHRRRRVWCPSSSTGSVSTSPTACRTASRPSASRRTAQPVSRRCRR